MNRIEKRFSELQKDSRKGLIPFVTVGDPDPAFTVAILHELVAAGADLLELGVPFSDPMADGPVIQRASERALAKGVGLRRVLEMVAEFRRQDANTPVVLMGYLNPVEMFGRERFAKAAHDAGVDGVLLVDFPPEESGDLATSLDAAGVARIFLAAPTTSAERLAQMAERARGFIYYVSFAGITGADHLSVGAVGARVRAIKSLTKTPVAVGFGIKDAAQARALAVDADAVVIGSALVEMLSTAQTCDSAMAVARSFLVPIRAALDASE